MVGIFIRTKTYLTFHLITTSILEFPIKLIKILVSHLKAILVIKKRKKGFFMVSYGERPLRVMYPITP